MSSFVLEIPRYRQSDSQPKIRITQEAYAVLTQVCAKTAIPMSQVASKAILYAVQHLEVKVKEDEDDEA